MQLERETKLVLSAADHARLLSQFPVVECSEQLNVYYLDPDRLEEEVGYFRVRFSSSGQALATLKLPMGWRGEMREMVEVEQPLADLGPALYPRPPRWIEVASDLPDAFAGLLSPLGIVRLRRLGWMRNRRCVLDLSPHGTVELDRVVLPGGGLHFEAEIEDPHEERHLRLVERIRTMAPSAAYSRKGKVTRFLEEIERSTGVR